MELSFIEDVSALLEYHRRGSSVRLKRRYSFETKPVDASGGSPSDLPMAMSRFVKTSRLVAYAAHGSARTIAGRRRENSPCSDPWLK